MDGICTLANDRVYDQLMALLNSIEVSMGTDMPVCVYPYDDHTERIATEIARRPQVTLYSDRASMQTWDQFARDAWDTHPSARQRWAKAGSKDYHRFGTHRRYCAFDGPFDRFIYMDADTLLLGDVTPIFQHLEQNDWVVYDFQYKDLTHVYETSSAKLEQVFSQERLESEIFCSGFYASKKNLFSAEQRQWLIAQLKNGDAEILYPMAPDQTLLNYMVMRSGVSSNNLARSLPSGEATGCCVTSSHFVERDHLLYDRGNRLIYLHYIGLSSKLFTQLCNGNPVQFPYRDLFLYYRYLHEPEKRPTFTLASHLAIQFPDLTRRVLRKFGLTIS